MATNDAGDRDGPYGRLCGAADHLRSPLLLAIRVYWGWSFFMAGFGKFTHWDRTLEGFTNLKIPAPAFNGGLAASAELLGGAMLVLGLWARLAAIPLVITMIVAFMTAHMAELRSIFSDEDKFSTAGPTSFLVASLVVLAFGPGAFSVDALLARRGKTSGAAG